MPSAVDIQIRVTGGDKAKAEIIGVAGALDKLPDSAKRGADSVKQGFWAADWAATNLKNTLVGVAKGLAFGAIGGGIGAVTMAVKGLSAEVNALNKEIGRVEKNAFGNIAEGWVEQINNPLNLLKAWHNATIGQITGRQFGFALQPEAPTPAAPVDPAKLAQTRASFARGVIEAATAAERAAKDPIEQTAKWAETLGNVENRAALIVQHYRELVTKQKDITASGKVVDAIGGDVSRAAVRGTAAYASASAEMQARQEQTRLQQRQLEQLEAMRRALESGQTVGVFSMDGAN